MNIIRLRPTLGPISRAGLLATLSASVVTTVVSSLARATMNGAADFLPLQLGPTLFFTISGVVGATLVFGGLARRLARPVPVFYVVAAGVLALSVLPDLSLLDNPPPQFAGANPGTVGVLVLEHVLVAVISVAILTTRGMRAGRPTEAIHG